MLSTGEWVTIIVALITAIAGLAGSNYIARKGKQSTDESVGAQLVGEALDQMRETIKQQGATIDRHEAELTNLKAALASRDRVVRASAMFIDRIGFWLANGLKGKRPQPDPILHEHIDVALWQQDLPQVETLPEQRLWDE